MPKFHATGRGLAQLENAEISFKQSNNHFAKSLTFHNKLHFSTLRPKSQQVFVRKKLHLSTFRLSGQEVKQFFLLFVFTGGLCKQFAFRLFGQTVNKFIFSKKSRNFRLFEQFSPRVHRSQKVTRGRRTRHRVKVVKSDDDLNFYVYFHVCYWPCAGSQKN